MLTDFVAILIILLFLIYVFYNIKYKSLLPSGPRGLPLVGNLLQLAGTKPHLKLSQWALQHGKLYTIKFGSKPVLVITDAKIMRELLGLTATAFSPTAEIALAISDGRWGLHSAAETRLEQRQFVNRVIRKFGFGEVSCKEALIKEEVKKLVDWIKIENDNKGKVYLKDILKQGSANIVWSISTGYEANHELNTMATGLHLIDHIHKVIRNGLLFCPWIKYLAPEASGYNGFKLEVNNMHKNVKDVVKQRILTRNRGEEPQNIIDAYIDKVESCQDKQSSFYGESGWKHCVSVIVTMFIAGGHGTGVTTNFIIFYLSVYPHVQQKVQQEIEEMIGSQREACLTDKRNMPYTEAVILEALRFSSTMATGVPHELSEDIAFQGYRLPKGMQLLPLLYHVHFDKSVWIDPENFRPERFLEDGIKLKEFVVPFQVGKKSCPGQQIAMDTLFLFVTMLFQKYSFEVDHSEVDSVAEYLDPVVALGLEPKPFPVLVIERI